MISVHPQYVTTLAGEYTPSLVHAGFP